MKLDWRMECCARICSMLLGVGGCDFSLLGILFEENDEKCGRTERTYTFIQLMLQIFIFRHTVDGMNKLLCSTCTRPGYIIMQHFPLVNRNAYSPNTFRFRQTYLYLLILNMYSHIFAQIEMDAYSLL